MVLGAIEVSLERALAPAFVFFSRVLAIDIQDWIKRTAGSLFGSIGSQQLTDKKGPEHNGQHYRTEPHKDF